MERIIDIDADLAKRVERRTETLDERDEWIQEAVTQALTQGSPTPQPGDSRAEFIERAVRARLRDE